MDALKSDWFDALEVSTQKHLVDEMQLLGFREPPLFPSDNISSPMHIGLA